MILAAYSLAITMDFALGIPLTLATSWRHFFAVLAAGTLIVALLDAIFVKAGPAEIGYPGFAWENEPAVAHLPVSEIFRSKWIAVGGLGIAACTFALSGTATWVVPAFITVQHMPPASGAIIGTLMGLSQVVFLIIGGYMADNMGKTFMIKLSALLALLTAILFVTSTVYEMSFMVLVLYSALSGLAVLGGGAIFSLMSEKYSDTLAPAAIGYSEVFGIMASFAAPWSMGAVIQATGGSFTAAFILFAVVEAGFLVLLMVLARDTAAAPGAIGVAAE
jgi:predicted MFS family arabinose efflux permease